MKRLPLLAAALFPLAALAEPPAPPTGAAASPPAHVMLQATQLQWGDGPPALEPGAQAVVLSGDPGAEGPFALRLKVPAGYRVALHWHPTDEQVTVIEGDMTLSMPRGNARMSQRLDAGGYALLPARMHHAASTQGGAVVQVAGMGPFQINYVEPGDDPRLRDAAP
jgi:hypothetical protein